MNTIRRLSVLSYESQEAPILLRIRSSTWFIITAVSTAVFTDVFLYAVIVPVLPFSLVDRLGVQPEDVQKWLSILLSAYGAGVLIAAPICGKLSDILPYRKGPLLIGILSLGSATLMLCLAKSLPVLIVARTLQGGSAGLCWVVGLALLADTVGEKKAGLAMGYVGAAYSVSALLAPFLGGIVYEKAGYNAVFFMSFGILVVDLLLRLLLIEQKGALRWRETTYPVVRADEARLSNEVIEIAVAAVSVEKTQPPHATLVKFANVRSGNEASDVEALAPAKDPRLPPILLLLRSRRLQATFWSSTLSGMILTGFDVTLPLFVKEKFGWTSLGAGLIFLAVLGPTFIQPLLGAYIDKHGPRRIGFIGPVMSVPPFICLRFVTDDTFSHKVLLMVLLLLIGIGIAFILTSTMAEFTYICAEKEAKDPGSMGKGGAYAQSYGLYTMTWALGCLLGAYFAGGIKRAGGFGTMGWAFGLLCGIVSAPCLLFMGGWIGKEKNRMEERVNEEERTVGVLPTIPPLAHLS